jgi:hypothetical protein
MCHPENGDELDGLIGIVVLPLDITDRLQMESLPLLGDSTQLRDDLRDIKRSIVRAGRAMAGAQGAARMCLRARAAVQQGTPTWANAEQCQ